MQNIAVATNTWLQQSIFFWFFIRALFKLHRQRFTPLLLFTSEAYAFKLCSFGHPIRPVHDCQKWKTVKVKGAFTSDLCTASSAGRSDFLSNRYFKVKGVFHFRFLWNVSFTLDCFERCLSLQIFAPHVVKLSEVRHIICIAQHFNPYRALRFYSL